MMEKPLDKKSPKTKKSEEIIDPLSYMLKLFKVRPDNVFAFNDRGTYWGLVTKDAKKYKLPKDMLK